jgi:hypothetical protein
MVAAVAMFEETHLRLEPDDLIPELHQVVLHVIELVMGDHARQVAQLRIAHGLALVVEDRQAGHGVDRLQDEVVADWLV